MCLLEVMCTFLQFSVFISATVTNKMKSNDNFSLDKENIVGKNVRKERKCFAAGCISALCLLFTIPAPFLST